MLMDRLNPAQKEAATWISSPVRIIAGAGSGKTSVLMARIEYLIKEAGVFPNKIMAITFTNKAAQEMKDRLEAACPNEGQRVRISTIHSLCSRILREDAAAAGFPKNFIILDGDDQRTLVRRIIKDLGLSLHDYPVGEAIGMISSSKMNGVMPDQAEDFANGMHQKYLVRIYERYISELGRMKAMDFDDLLLNTDALLRMDERVRSKWQNRLDFIHVDEFQDVDPIQYSIVRSLVRDDACLTVVGDPDQTIYTWRGASVDIILDFEKDFPDAKTVILDQNYRSSQPILDAGNALIANNKARIKKDLFSTRKDDNPIIFFDGSDDDQEAVFVAMMIRRLHSLGYGDHKKIPYSDIAILYRANYLSRAFEKELVSLKIPYRLLGGVRFFERREVKDILAYMHLMRKADDSDELFASQDIYLERIINVPARRIGEKFIDQLRQESKLRGINELQVLRDPQQISAKKARAFLDVLEKVEEDYEKYGLAGLVDSIIRHTDYWSIFPQEEQESREENIEELKKDIAQALADNEELTLEDYLQDLSLYSTMQEEKSSDAVTLMTVHAAKGTEFPVVFASGLNEGIFPSARSTMENGIRGLEEERRLMYVAITRAKDLLFLTWNTGYAYSAGSFKTPSRFINELPTEQTATMSSPGPVPMISDQQKEEAEKKNPSRTALDDVRAAEKKVRSARTFASRAKATPKKQSYRKGDKVSHRKFGQGTVLQASGSIVEVEFEPPFGIKKISSAFLSPAV